MKVVVNFDKAGWGSLPGIDRGKDGKALRVRGFLGLPRSMDLPRTVADSPDLSRWSSC